MQGEAAAALADMSDFSRQSPGGAYSLDVLTSQEQSPAPRIQASGRSLKRLRRITDGPPEAAAGGTCHPESSGKPHDEVHSSHPHISRGSAAKYRATALF